MRTYRIIELLVVVLIAYGVATSVSQAHATDHMSPIGIYTNISV